MKKILTIVLFTIPIICFGQNYNIKQLKDISKIWGECYLFHPSVIRADKNLEWEKELVNFLPLIKEELSTQDFIKVVNKNLLSKLDDPFTICQNQNIRTNKVIDNFNSSNQYDYVKVTEDHLLDIRNITFFDSLITDRNSNKPLVIDLRIKNKLDIDQHSNTFFDYFASILINEPIDLHLKAKREHFGWDEYNDWWYYEQRWKVLATDKQVNNAGKLLPFLSYKDQLQQTFYDYNFEEFTSIQRPIYFLTNNSFLSYYKGLMLSLKSNRKNTFVLNESSQIFNSSFSELKTYHFNNYDFILNPVVYLKDGITITLYDANYTEITNNNLNQFIINKTNIDNPQVPFSFKISPTKYNSSNEHLSIEEKILGIIKIWTIINNFHVHPDLRSQDWDLALDKYLELAQKTSTDKQYYKLIQNMMSLLNDSHVSTFHPSILDFSKIFVAPIKFEWIQEKAIVTAIDSSLNVNMKIGDEITSINSLSISELLEKEKKNLSCSNKQSLLNTVISTTFFAEEAGSAVKFGIKKGKKEEFIEIPRTMYVFQFFGYEDNRASSSIFDQNIGYLNLAFLTNSIELEKELIKMQNTNGLIIDLRSSYPIWDYNHFLELLFNNETTLRINETPIVSCNSNHSRNIEITEYIITPDTNFDYIKPIAVLIDKTMISRPEDVAICLKALPNVTFIGEQTQGTNGEATKISLPGGGETSFTGQKIRFGNGDEFQGIGIIPDIVVERTIKGVKEQRDEILDKALDFLNNQ